MDNYTLMCSKLTELQEAWELRDSEGDWIYDSFLKKTYRLTIVDADFLVDIWGHTINPKSVTYLPDLEDLIAMLEGRYCYWELWLSYNKEFNHKRYKGLLSDKNKEPKLGSGGNTPKEALLKLVAWELYNKTWDEESQEWREG